MSTMAEYTAAAKAYANSTRVANVAEAQYNSALAVLNTARSDQSTKLATLIQVAKELPSDVP